MRVGFASSVITPPLPVQLAGYGCERPAEGVADELRARALVCEHDGRTVALLAAELLWLERRHLRLLRPLVTELCGIAGDDLMVACTHGHSGPDTMDWFHFAPVDPGWLQVLLRQLAGTVYVASRNLRPAAVEALVGAVPIGVNRRVNTIREGFRLGHNESGPVDQTLTVLRVTDRESGALLGSVVHHATHPVVLGGQSRVISGDWCGELCRQVEASVGGSCLFVNGACGDINPRVGAGRTYAEMLRVGRQAAGATIELLSREPGEPVDGVATAAAHFAVPHKPHPYLDVPYERRLREDGGMVIETQALRLGPVTFLSSPGECLIDTGRAIVERTRAPRPLVLSDTNDYTGYLPLPHIWEQGGYEPGATMLTAEAVLTWVDRAVAVGDAVA
ncbi:MAG: neutral/alkaline non-lysosomal ceramidase N-terminal domain-containing protein [Fimbriimonadaceae bacterium]|nr:neutral/alkaline non-lysosomal ceramidase N-terminal domain-containing protein [Fimbriimonadaceae bacterium]